MCLRACKVCTFIPKYVCVCMQIKFGELFRILYTGYTQNNGAVLMVNKGKPHHSVMYICIQYITAARNDRIQFSVWLTLPIRYLMELNKSQKFASPSCWHFHRSKHFRYVYYLSEHQISYIDQSIIVAKPPPGRNHHKRDCQ
jgi:hypothetical protein